MGIKTGWRGRGGWSLVELSLTLILAGLLTSLALPAFVQWGDRLEQEQFMELFSEDIRMTQREASVREEVTFLQLDTKRAECIRSTGERNGCGKQRCRPVID